MNYQKPEVTNVCKAMKAIQNHVQKGSFTPQDNVPQDTTIPAYEADE